MKHVRKRLTYANVMSSIAVFLVLGGATAFAATKIGAKQIKANSILTGKIKKEAVTQGKIKAGAVGESRLAEGSVTTSKIANAAVTEGKLANNAVGNTKIANDAVTGEKVKESTLSQVPSAANAAALGGIGASEYAQRMFARVSYTTATESLIAASPGISVAAEGALGFPRLEFPRSMDACAIVGSANSGSGTQIFRRSSGTGTALVQFALKDENGAAVRSDFEVIAVC